MRVLWLVLLATSLALAAEGEYFVSQPTEPIFKVGRNLNRNEVHYVPRLREDCSFDNNPLRYFWRMLEEGPEVTESMRIWERPAYGFDAERVDRFTAKVELNALPDQSITMRAEKIDEDCRVRAWAEHNGDQVLFVRAFAFARSRFIGPKVEWVDLYSRSVSGTAYKRRVIPD